MNTEQNSESRIQNAGSTAPCLNDFFDPSEAAPSSHNSYDFFGDSHFHTDSPL
jgi:hypothetical protein